MSCCVCKNYGLKFLDELSLLEEKQTPVDVRYEYCFAPEDRSKHASTIKINPRDPRNSIETIKAKAEDRIRDLASIHLDVRQSNTTLQNLRRQLILKSQETATIPLDQVTPMPWLGKLPSELLQIILRYAMEVNNYEYPYSTRIRQAQAQFSPNMCMALLISNKWLSAQAMMVLYSYPTFCFEFPDDLWSWMQNVSPDSLSNVYHIEIRFREDFCLTFFHAGLGFKICSPSPLRSPRRQPRRLLPRSPFSSGARQILQESDTNYRFRVLKHSLVGAGKK